MKRVNILSTSVKAVFFSISLFVLCSSVKADIPPFSVISNLFNQSETDSLGLTTADGTETITVFAPNASTDKFSNGVVMVAFKDTLYCMWQSSALDEDNVDTWVAYSRSADGINWTTPMVLAETIPNGYCSSGGWWVNGDTLVGYINVWPSSVYPRGGYASYVTSVDGMNWSEVKAVLMADGDTLTGIFEQDPHALPDGRIINAAHFQPGLTLSPIYTDDSSGVRGWVRASFTNLSMSGEVSREIEPSWYLRDDDTLVMVFRDQDGTFYKLASESGDRGETWSNAVLTNMPDSRSKQCAGNIADSTRFFVSNPVNSKARIPLVVTLSKNGRLFNTAYVLRKGGDDLQPQRFGGQHKSIGYHYPKSMVYNDTLYVSYSTNKEDVEYTRIPLTSLVLDTTTTYTLTYIAGSSGRISGYTSQTVFNGSNGFAVQAVPNTGYHFVDWSDGSTDNPRTDTNVTTNITVTASYAINTYTLTYTAGSDGSISGSTPQMVDHGSNGTAIQAVPDSGYHFVDWSDGNTDNPRTDSNVTADITVTANFAINTTIAHTSFKAHITVLPNPVEDYLIVKIENTKISTVTIKIFDLSGKILKVIDPEENIMSISMKDMAPAAYNLVIIKNNGEFVTYPIIKK